MEVDSPDEPDGPSFFQFTTYVAKEKQTHKKQFSYDKTRPRVTLTTMTFPLATWTSA